MTDYKMLMKCVDYIRSIADHYNFNEHIDDFIKFYVKKEQEASVLLEEIGERK